MGWTTAPVTGSGPCPTCNAFVEKPQSGGKLLPIYGEVPAQPAEGLADRNGWAATSAPAAVREKLEQVGAGDHRHRLVTPHHQHRLLAAQQRPQMLTHRRNHAHLAHSRRQSP